MPNLPWQTQTQIRSAQIKFILDTAHSVLNGLIIYKYYIFKIKNKCQSLMFFWIILPSVFLLAMPFGLSICAVIGDICTQSNLGEYQRRINNTFLYYESQIAGNKHVFIIFRMISYSGTVVCCYIVKCGVSQFP